MQATTSAASCGEEGGVFFLTSPLIGLIELLTSPTLPRCSRVTGQPKVKHNIPARCSHMTRTPTPCWTPDLGPLITHLPSSAEWQSVFPCGKTQTNYAEQSSVQCSDGNSGCNHAACIGTRTVPCNFVGMLLILIRHSPTC